jgi:hypothetical protein
LLGAAAVVRAAEEHLVTEAEQPDIERAVVAARAALGAAAYEAEYARGSEMSLDEAFAEVVRQR